MMKNLMTRQEFLKNNKIGIIIKTFARYKKDLARRVEMAADVAKRAAKLQINGLPVISRVNILVWADKRFKNESDFGRTANAMRARFKSNSLVSVHVITRGDLYCSSTNYGIAHQLCKQIQWSLILSPEAASYLTMANVNVMIDAAQKGARVVGLALNELRDSILEGRIANTFAMWHNLSLLTVGGFDLRAAKPVEPHSAHYIKGWDAKHGEVFYQRGGTEEIIPLVYLTNLFGPCIAPVLPRGNQKQRYQVPDAKTFPELALRHAAKMATKQARQNAFLAEVDADASFLKGGVIKPYRRF